MTSAPHPAPRFSVALLLLFVAVAAAITAPALLRPPMMHDSFWIDINWADQFYAELARGIAYPRWLPQSHDGLGAPVFYFYPPLAFYLTSALQGLGLSVYPAVIGTFGVALAASGAAMYLWLLESSRRPLLGAVLFMVLPYHVADFYHRGALAESCAYALVPLVALGLKRAAAGRGLAPLALSYATLIGTHLPVALLASLFLAAPYALKLIADRREALWPLAAGLTLGIGLAALYLVPALSLQYAVRIGHFWEASYFQPKSWSFFYPSRWISPEIPLLFIPIVASAALAAVLVLKRDRDPWALYAIAIGLVVAGAVPGLWSIPLLAKVQFPWRAITLMEFALATAIARSALPRRELIGFAAPLLLLSVVQITAGHGRSDTSLRRMLATHTDVPEYLPRGAPAEQHGNSQWALDVAKAVRAGAAAGPATFYFPAWSVACSGKALRSYADPKTQLLMPRGPNCTARLARLPSEQAGLLISVLSALLLAFAALAGSARRAPRSIGRPSPA